MSLAMSPSSGGEIAPARDAATVLLVRDGAQELEVFMVVRHHQIDFASGALVFPGGKVEPEDAVWGEGDRERAARAAAIRETYEECGVLLARPRAGGALVSTTHTGGYAEALRAHDLAPALDALTPFAHWITPKILPKRFDTRFFIAVAPEGQTATHDGAEAVDSVWIAPRQALEEGARGRRTLVLATRLNLELLARSASAAQAVAAAAERRLVAVEPLAEKTAAGHRLTIPIEAGYGGPHFDV